MKRLTSIGVTDESLIHPGEIQEKLFALRCKAEQQVLEHHSEFVHIDCPACLSSRHDNAFVKRNFSFRECNDCRSIFLSPRPANNHLESYYLTSDYAAFLRSDEYASATHTFRAKEAGKRADRLAVLNQKVSDSTDQFLLYAPKSPLVSNALQALGYSGITILPAPWDRDKNVSYKQGGDIVSAFDVIERLPEPNNEIKHLVPMLRVGGMIMCILRSGSGFDFLSLWQHSDIQPLEHMNLLTVEGASIILRNNGLEIQEISTPGSLDIQFVERIKKEKNIRINRFVDYLLEFRDEFSKNEFQQFLQRGLLSSHLVMVAKKLG